MLGEGGKTGESAVEMDSEFMGESSGPDRRTRFEARGEKEEEDAGGGEAGRLLREMARPCLRNLRSHRTVSMFMQ